MTQGETLAARIGALGAFGYIKRSDILPNTSELIVEIEVPINNDWFNNEDDLRDKLIRAKREMAFNFPFNQVHIRYKLINDGLKRWTKDIGNRNCQSTILKLLGLNGVNI